MDQSRVIEINMQPPGEQSKQNDPNQTNVSEEIMSNSSTLDDVNSIRSELSSSDRVMTLQTRTITSRSDVTTPQENHDDDSSSSSSKMPEIKITKTTTNENQTWNIALVNESRLVSVRETRDANANLQLERIPSCDADSNQSGSDSKTESLNQMAASNSTSNDDCWDRSSGHSTKNNVDNKEAKNSKYFNEFIDSEETKSILNNIREHQKELDQLKSDLNRARKETKTIEQEEEKEKLNLNLVKDCVEIGRAGEQACRDGDHLKGAQMLREAIEKLENRIERMGGQEFLGTLGALCSQLGNAYIHLGELEEGIAMHDRDLHISKQIGDKSGEGKAYCNLSNAYKSQGLIDKAIDYSLKHLSIARNLEEKSSECRALHNLGNLYCLYGKQWQQTEKEDPTNSPSQATVYFKKALEYFTDHYNLARNLNDILAQKKVTLLLGNTYQLMSSFDDAVYYYLEHTNLAQLTDDNSAMRQGYNSLGNIYIFLNDFDIAALHYKKALKYSMESKATEAQCCYTLGNTYTLAHNYQEAILYHKRHLAIAVELGDVMGQSRACWSIANAQIALKEHRAAAPYALKHHELTAQIPCKQSEAAARSILRALEIVVSKADMEKAKTINILTSERIEPKKYDATSSEEVMRRTSITDGYIDDTEVDILDDDRKPRTPPSLRRNQKVRSSQSVAICPSPSKDTSSMTLPESDDDFFHLLEKVQCSRMEEQRAFLDIIPTSSRSDSKHRSLSNTTPTTPSHVKFTNCKSETSPRMDSTNGASSSVPFGASPKLSAALRRVRAITMTKSFSLSGAASPSNVQSPSKKSAPGWNWMRKKKDSSDNGQT